MRIDPQLNAMPVYKRVYNIPSEKFLSVEWNKNWNYYASTKITIKIITAEKITDTEIQ